MACYFEVPHTGEDPTVNNSYISIEALNFLLNYYYAIYQDCQQVEDQILNVLFPNHDFVFITSNIIDLTTVTAFVPVGYTGTTTRLLSEVGQTFPSSLQNQLSIDFDFVGGVETNRTYDQTNWPYGLIWNPALSGWDFRMLGTSADAALDLVGAKLSDVDFQCILGNAIPACFMTTASDFFGGEVYGIPMLSDDLIAVGTRAVTPDYVLQFAVAAYPASTCQEIIDALEAAYLTPTAPVIPAGQTMLPPVDLDFIVPILPVEADVTRIFSVSYRPPGFPSIPVALWNVQWKWNSDGTKYDEFISVTVPDQVVVDGGAVDFGISDSPINEFIATLPYVRYTTMDAAGLLAFGVPACAISPTPPSTYYNLGQGIKCANFTKIFNPFGIKRN